jgi:Bacterial mobilisation protein (MobC)
MARYERSYSGERRTAPLHIQLTPSERAELDSAAALQGANVSDYSRELLFRRSAALVAGTRRNPEAAALARELSALGNNLNQIARHANTTGELRDVEVLEDVLDLIKHALSRVIAL